MKKRNENYKYYAGLTSQMAFCATPLRLDPYNKCQFGCQYCYASTRQGAGRNEKLKIASPDALLKRILRVQKGLTNSALDEFIQQRIPFQLGGMSDPFSAIEKKVKTTKRYIEILRDFQYPFIISTKSNLIFDDEYLDIIKDCNAYIRLSITAIKEDLRIKIDKGCPSESEIMRGLKKISLLGIPTSVRIQPIIPGFEEIALDIIEKASKSNVNHISAEYLKLSLDSNLKFGRDLKEIMNNEPIKFYKDMGAKKMGREYTLPQIYREPHLIKMAILARSKGMTFGYADNDYIIYSDGNSCCNASDLYLNNSSVFEANIPYIAKNKKDGEIICFDDLKRSWIPKNKISTYLNSKARIICSTSNTQWMEYMKTYWIGMKGIYAPDFFKGISKTEEKDYLGLPVYIINRSPFYDIYNKINTITSRSIEQKCKNL